MSLIAAISLFLFGLILVVYFSERLVEGVVGTSLSLGISAFLISVVFIGFDPENLALGGVATFEQASGLALGTIFGSAMVAVALALGVTVLISPLTFSKAPPQVVVVPVLATLLLGLLIYDGLLSRLDGVWLLTGFALCIWYLADLSTRGLDISPRGEVKEVLEEEQVMTPWKAIALLIASLAAIIVGSEMIVLSSDSLLELAGISETVFGMTVLALLISIEELARELPAALKGRPDITYGNVVGSVLAFMLFNAGVIALIRPLTVSDDVIYFHFPMCILTVFFISLCMLWKRLPRWSGGVLLLLYGVFFAGSYLI